MCEYWGWRLQGLRAPQGETERNFFSLEPEARTWNEREAHSYSCTAPLALASVRVCSSIICRMNLPTARQPSVARWSTAS